MYKSMTIDGKDVKFSANASTPFRFKQIFQKDLFSILGNEAKAETEGVEAVTELAYIMAKQGEGADMNRLNQEDFISWLEGFGPMAFIDNAEEILNIYMGSSVGTSTP